MWGENWSTLIWGGQVAAAAQVPLASWALIALGVLLGITSLKARTSAAARAVPLLMVFLVPMLATVAAVNLPVRFVNGTIADADEVNANFDYLAARTSQVRIVYEDAAGTEIGDVVPLEVGIDGEGPVLLRATDGALGVAIIDTQGGVVPGDFRLDPEFFEGAACTGLRVGFVDPDQAFGLFGTENFEGYAVRYSDGQFYRWSGPVRTRTMRSVLVPGYLYGGATPRCFEYAELTGQAAGASYAAPGLTVEPFAYSDAGLVPPFLKRAFF